MCSVADKDFDLFHGGDSLNDAALNVGLQEHLGRFAFAAQGDFPACVGRLVFGFQEIAQCRIEPEFHALLLRVFGQGRASASGFDNLFCCHSSLS